MAKRNDLLTGDASTVAANNIHGEMCMTEQELKQRAVDGKVERSRSQSERSRRGEFGCLTAPICADGPLFVYLMPEQRPQRRTLGGDGCRRSRGGAFLFATLRKIVMSASGHLDVTRQAFSCTVSTTTPSPSMHTPVLAPAFVTRRWAWTAQAVVSHAASPLLPDLLSVATVRSSSASPAA